MHRLPPCTPRARTQSGKRPLELLYIIGTVAGVLS